MLFRTLKDDAMAYFNDRGRRIFLYIFLLFIILAGRLLYLQLFMYDELYRRSESNRIRLVRVIPDRGFIKDRNGVILVRNTPAYELELVREDLKNSKLEPFLDNISLILPIDKNKVIRRVKQAGKYQSAKVTRGLSFDQLSYFLEYSSEYSGLQYVVSPMRGYIDGDIFSHILGYLGEISEREVEGNYKAGDVVGKTGLEKQYEQVLRGVEGFRHVEVDSFGRVYETLEEKPAVPGKNIVLTIDYRLQKYVSEAMQGHEGAVVILDNMDNTILSMYSAPTYDLDVFNPFITEANWKKLLEDPKKPLLNRAVEGVYPPGSVFKTLVAAAALNEGLITPDTTFYCGGSYKSTARTNIIHHCWKRSGHGEINLIRALAVSCDVYFYNLGSLLGIDKISEYAIKLGLGRHTGIELPNEKTGVFPTKDWKLETLNEPWYPGETVNVAIGQGYTTTTPLQIAVMTSSIFNGGNVYKPRIVDSIEDPVSGERTIIPVEAFSEIPISDDVIEVIMKGLVNSIEQVGGTSRRGKIDGLLYGGKTGTAQVISLKHTENMKEHEIPDHWRDHSWYVGVYPAKTPRYTIVVMVEHGGSGGRISAPVAASIIKRMLELGYD